eukprot:g19765.t1
MNFTGSGFSDPCELHGEWKRTIFATFSTADLCANSLNPKFHQNKLTGAVQEFSRQTGLAVTLESLFSIGCHQRFSFGALRASP